MFNTGANEVEVAAFQLTVTDGAAPVVASPVTLAGTVRLKLQVSSEPSVLAVKNLPPLNLRFGVEYKVV